MQDNILHTKGIYRRFKSGSSEVVALRDVSMTIPRGKLTILRGRSGSGKTTLINILGTLDKPDEGEVWFDQELLNQWRESQRDQLRRRHVGFIFQSVALISTMSALENVEFALRVASNPEIKNAVARAEECLSFVGMKPRMKHMPSELSGGEQQRVAIARAIAHKPKVLFADEPTAELDVRTGLSVMRLFQDLVRQEGITVVMTTHDPNMMELADHVYTLNDGVISEALVQGGDRNGAHD